MSEPRLLPVTPSQLRGWGSYSGGRSQKPSRRISSGGQWHITPRPPHAGRRGRRGGEVGLAGWPNPTRQGLGPQVLRTGGPTPLGLLSEEVAQPHQVLGSQSRGATQRQCPQPSSRALVQRRGSGQQRDRLHRGLEPKGAPRTSAGCAEGQRETGGLGTRSGGRPRAADGDGGAAAGASQRQNKHRTVSWSTRLGRSLARLDSLRRNLYPRVPARTERPAGHQWALTAG